MLELTLKQPLDRPIDGRQLSPVALGAMPLSELMALPMQFDRADPIRLDDVFWVRCHSGPAEVTLIQGDCRFIQGLGTQMEGGTLMIDGDAGDRVGEAMSGGTILVSGNAGQEVAMGMRSGLIAIARDCGDRLAPPMPGERAGMRGGDLLVGGNVGSRACERMRRGTVGIGGRTGDYLAANMIAGTILASGPVGEQWGLGMQRGSLLFADESIGSTHATWSDSRSLELSFLPLVWNHLRAIQDRLNSTCQLVNRPLWNAIPVPSTRWVDRRIGDLAFEGRGEALSLRRLSSSSSSATRDATEGNNP